MSENYFAILEVVTDVRKVLTELENVRKLLAQSEKCPKKEQKSVKMSENISKFYNSEFFSDFLTFSRMGQFSDIFSYNPSFTLYMHLFR